LIPVEADGFSLDGLNILLKRIFEIKSELNDKLDIIGVFFTDAYQNTKLFKNIREMFEEELGEVLLKTVIRHDNKVKESNSFRIPLAMYDGNAKATKDYFELAYELGLI